MAHRLLDNRTAATPVISPKFLLEQIVADLHWAALQFGMFTMLANAASKPGSTQGLRAFRHLAHDDARIMRLALRYSASAGLAPATAAKLDKIYADVARQYSQAAPFVAAAILSQGQRDDLHHLLPTLRRTAQDVVAALGDVEASARGQLPDMYSRDSATIRQFLGRAARGEVTDTGPDGVLKPPRLEQRRHSPRAETRMRCRIAFAGGEADGTIVDVSREGLGVECDAPIQETEVVSVLVGGRRLDATVARRRGGQIGLLLKSPLAVADPLFMGG